MFISMWEFSPSRTIILESVRAPWRGFDSVGLLGIFIDGLEAATLAQVSCFAGRIVVTRDSTS